MIGVRRVLVSASCVCLMLSGALVANANSVFNFESDAVGKTTPFTDTVGGLSATFTGQASVCNVNGLFATLSGNALIQSYCVTGQSGPLAMSFSSNLSSIAFDFATAGGPASMALDAFENGKLVGTASFTSSVPTGFFNGEGLASFGGVFNSLTISSSDILAVDNINAATVPEPGPIAMIGLGVSLFAFLLRRAR